MSKTVACGLALSLAVLFLASVVLGQEAEKKTPAPTRRTTNCEPDNCISKVLYLPNFSSAYELQEVVNTFRTTADITQIYPNQSEHSISVKCTPEQLAIAEKLLSVLETFRLSGGHNRSSVLVYAPKGSPEPAVPQKAPGQPTQAASRIQWCNPPDCFIKALYLPDFSTTQMQDLINRIRTTTQMTRTVPSLSNHVLVYAGTSEQVALAEKLTNE